MLDSAPTTKTGTMVLVFGEIALNDVKAAGYPARDVSLPAKLMLDERGNLLPGVAGFKSYVILTPHGGEAERDAIALTIDDTRCRWAYHPESLDPEDIVNAIENARPMWTDEVASLDDIPDSGPAETFRTGFTALDYHGFRLVTPAFMPVIGPYGSGKSVFLRQLLVNLWRIHGWKFLLTSFEEKVKPRYQRDLRRHLIGKPMADWSDEDVARADREMNECCKFLQRKRNTVLDQDRLVDRIEYAARVYGIRVVCIDPVNEIEHQLGKGESRTDYFGRFIMKLKQVADDYNLLMIVCAHPPKDGVEKRLNKSGVLTLNDGADTAHWGNKADIGLCLWRNLDGPTMLHIDKLKDHESMGKPTLAELFLDPRLNRFTVGRVGYDIMGGSA